MAPTRSKDSTQAMGLSDGELSLTFEKSTFLVNNYPILKQVPNNIVVTSSPSISAGDTKNTTGCFLGFDAAEPNSRHVAPIGELTGIRFMSIFRFKPWWSTHWIGQNGKDVEVETQMMILDKNHSGRPYVLLLPLIEGSFRSSLQAGVDNYVDICVESGSSQVCESRFRTFLYMHVGYDPYRLVRDAMKVVRVHLGSFRLLEEKTPPSILDKFGWCTWDAVYREVDPKSVRDGVKGLAEGGCPPQWVLIDDGWQSICHDDQDPILDTEGMDRMVAGTTGANESPRLKTFEFNYKFRDYESPRVPSNKGMGAFIRDLKEEFRTVDNVYVWHALLGYWGGVRPNAPGMPESNVVVPRLSQGLKKSMDDLAVNNILTCGLGFVPPELAYRLYDGLHSHLVSEGIDGVKIDAIHLLEMISEDNGGRVEIARAYYKALSDSVRRYFNGNGVVASMEQGNDFMFLGTEVISLGRAGDDFWVTDPAGDPRGSFWLQGCHMVHCAYNSLWLANFIYPDWDMFQTTHPLAEFHAASRAISGGPIYISDRIGEHNFKLLKRLMLPDGSILRCQSYALPTRDCLFDDPLHDGKTMLKIWNLNRYTGMLGLFNCQGGGWCCISRRHKGEPKFSNRLDCLASPKDIEWKNGNVNPVPQIQGDTTFAVYSFLEEKLKLMKLTERLEFSLEPFTYELLTVSPVHFLTGKLIKFAPIGLVNMLNSGGAIQSLDYEESESRVKIEVKGSGEMRMFASEEPRTCRIDGAGVEFCYDDYMISIQVPWPPGFSLIEYLF
ncbi:galactinol--sucrose galactosyltransferase isoform X1 [Ricinus communis]|uniref:galactinol--sucrose galactosyltransferase isoform X1 n=1 Tax=Ricinus communis TaxID=3988 RepID=UPI00201A696E|nr:galactinol--sucrose galactosyltransferase isoform X1 [Ricinus communis]